MHAGVHPTAMTHIDYAGHRIEYGLRRSDRRRTIGIAVKPDGSVQAAAPRWASAEAVHAFVREKAGWILKHQLRLAASGASPVPQRQFAEGESLPLLGQDLALHYADPGVAVPPQAWREEGRLIIRGLPAEHTDEPARQAAVRQLLEAWYRGEAERYFAAVAATYSGQLGLDAPRISIGAAQRRWGSCNARGALRFNWRLLLAPEPLADYVAAHEVAHRIELNHSLGFWRLVAKLVPDFKTRERTLNSIAAALTL